MDFYEVLDQVIDLLKKRRRASYRALKVQFKLGDESLEALKDELIKVHKLAIDQEGEMFVWTGDTASEPSPPPTLVPATQEPVSPPVSASAGQQKEPPLAYTSKHLTEKILTSRSALEGEREHVTVLFADIKDSTLHDWKLGINEEVWLRQEINEWGQTPLRGIRGHNTYFSRRLRPGFRHTPQPPADGCFRAVSLLGFRTGQQACTRG